MTITNLTQDNFREIIQHLNLFEIRAMSLTCKKIREILRSEEILKFIGSCSFAKSLYSRATAIRQGLTFQIIVTKSKELPKLMTAIQLATLEQCELSDTIKTYEEWTPQDIYNAAKSEELLNPREIELLKAYIKPRDTIMIWECIGEMSSLPFPLPLPSVFDRSLSKNVIENAKKYPEWCQNNRNILSTITELNLYKKSIRDLTPLTTLVNLNILQLSENSIEDLTSLETLIHLKELVLSENRIQLLTPLKSLTNLKGLDLSGNSIEDLTSLTTLVNLDWLYLSGNSIQDVTPLTTLVNLTCLSLGKNCIQDLTPLNTLTNLHRLYLPENRIEDLTPLSGLLNLMTLNLSQNRIKDVTPLKTLVKLNWLDLSYNRIENHTPLEGLKIEKLNVFGNPCSKPETPSGTHH